MATSSFDLVVIGAGAAGGGAAHAASAKGVRVAQIERDKVGGTCLNYGCDPTKTLLHIAQVLYQAQHSAKYGLSIPRTSLDWRHVQDYVQGVIDMMRGGSLEEARAQLKEQGIEYIHGEASFVSPHEVAVNGRSLAAERIIIASGSQALIPEIAGLQEAGFVTNVGALAFPSLPARLAIIGGGAIGIEFAQMFQRFGVAVTVIERGSLILDKEDRELAETLCNLLTQEGIQFVTRAEVQCVQRVAGGKKLIYTCGQNKQQELVVDEILLALGRRPTLEKLNLEEIGVKTTKKGLEVDACLRTSVPHIWAAGDVIGGYKFTHVANEQGKLAAWNALAESPRPFDASVIPWVTFTDPPLAHVGPTEEELRQQKRTYRARSVPFKAIERALTLGKTEGVLKLLVDEQEHILGSHILGPGADELISLVTLAMHAGLSTTTLASTILPYPTLSEGVLWAASDAQ